MCGGISGITSSSITFSGLFFKYTIRRIPPIKSTKTRAIHIQLSFIQSTKENGSSIGPLISNIASAVSTSIGLTSIRSRPV